MPNQENQAFIDLTLCGDAVSVQSDVVETDIINLTVDKVANCEYALLGGNICYTVTITNDSDVDFIEGTDEMGGLKFRDELTANLSYVENTFNYTIFDIDDPDPEPPHDPVFVEPDIDSDNVMTFEPLELSANQFVVIKFCVKVDRMPEPPTGA